MKFPFGGAISTFLSRKFLLLVSGRIYAKIFKVTSIISYITHYISQDNQSILFTLIYNFRITLYHPIHPSVLQIFVSEKMCGYPTNYILRKVHLRHHRLPKFPLASFRPGPLTMDPLRGRQLIPSDLSSEKAPWMMGASRCKVHWRMFELFQLDVELILIVGFGWWFGIN